MKKDKPVKEQYSVTIFSQTDVRKRPIAFRISRGKLIAAAGGIGLAALLAISVAIASFALVSGYSEQLDVLSAQLDERTIDLAALSVGPTMMQEAYPVDTLEDPGIQHTPVETQPPATLRLMPQYAVQISKSMVELQESAQTVMKTASSASAVPSGGISIGEAMTQINERYEAQIELRIEDIKAGAIFDTFNTAYDGDIEGDSDRVNNWADVMAVFAVATGTELRGLRAIPEADMALLEEIFISMNELEVASKTTTQKPAANSDAANDTPPVTTLTACLSANSLTYEEGAALFGFDKEQKQALEELMSPDYYTVFAELLGIDYYDGMNADELAHILSNLQEGTIGETIVQAALTRLGNPYSKGKRGSGRYVDCSYFAWWVYDQAGVIIPTSSVEQARYCYKNGSAVEMENLQPGDLIFWSKTSCDCGRWHEVHHTAIYLGDNKIIEASSRRGRVVINELWSGGEWRVFMCARPYV